MNILDDMPDIPACPACGHDGEGLQWAMPSEFIIDGVACAVQCACLACGAHGKLGLSYQGAIEHFSNSEFDPLAVLTLGNVVPAIRETV